MPNAAPDAPVLKSILGDWMVSGVTKYLSGAATQPACTTNNTGYRQHEPDAHAGRARPPASTLASRCSTSRAIPICPKRISSHFNPRAFAMAQPLSATVGNFGNVPLGILRNPGFWNWDLTLAASLPGAGSSAGDAQARRAAAALQHLQHPAVHHDEHGADVPGRSERCRDSTTCSSRTRNPGRYTAAIEPRQFGVTFRMTSSPPEVSGQGPRAHFLASSA